MILPGERIADTPEIELLPVNQQALGEAPAANRSDHANGVSSGLNAGHAGGHLALELPLNERQDAEIGTGGDESVELAVPVVAAGHVFAVSALARCRPEIETGKLSWRVSIEEFEDDMIRVLLVGLRLADQPFVHGGGRNLAALSVEDGSVYGRNVQTASGWTDSLCKTRMAVTDIDSNLFMLRNDNGSVLWDHCRTAIRTILYGAPSPAIFNNQLAVATYGGELSLLDADNGDVIR